MNENSHNHGIDHSKDNSFHARTSPARKLARSSLTGEP
jgi:hypothetical protein